MSSTISTPSASSSSSSSFHTTSSSPTSPSVEYGILQAANFAAFKHRSQKRKDPTGTPYINHPIGVAFSIVEIGGVKDLDILQAAILHDTVEDTDTTFEEIESAFGPGVRDIVKEVTDNKSLRKDERKMEQVSHAKHKSYQARVVKLADKLWNLNDLLRAPPAFWNVKRIQGYFVWAKKVTDELKGTNEGLEKGLEKVYSASITHDGKEYPVIPKDIDLDKFLSDYYADMRLSKD